MPRAAAALVLALAASGCVLDRSGLGPLGADAATPDAGAADPGAGREDGGAGACPDDASAEDAGDAALDACIPSP